MITHLQAATAAPITLYYCKAGIPTGQTIRISQGKSVHQTSAVNLTACNGSMIHGNATGAAKKSGARCTMVITSGTVTFNTENS